MKTIIAPIDFSPVSDAVVNGAANLARALKARVILMTVIQPPAVFAEYMPMVENIAEITAAGEKNAARQLTAIENKLKNEFVPAESVVASGSPVPAIIEQARENQADYIVMGSHGHGALYDLLVGSTTHGVLLRAKCPVVIVPSAQPLPTRTPRKKRTVLA